MKLNKTKWIWIGFIICLIIMFFFELFGPSENSKTEQTQNWEALDTFVPRGFRLVPIQISNYESLGELIGANAYVDLRDPKTKHPVAQGLRIVKSNVEENTYAVLVANEKVTDLLKNGDEFFAIVRSRQEGDAEIQKLSHRNIIWED